MVNSWRKCSGTQSGSGNHLAGQKVLRESEFLKQAVPCSFNLELSTLKNIFTTTQQANLGEATFHFLVRHFCKSLTLSSVKLSCFFKLSFYKRFFLPSDGFDVNSPHNFGKTLDNPQGLM